VSFNATLPNPDLALRTFREEIVIFPASFSRESTDQINISGSIFHPVDDWNVCTQSAWNCPNTNYGKQMNAKRSTALYPLGVTVKTFRNFRGMFSPTLRWLAKGILGLLGRNLRGVHRKSGVAQPRSEILLDGWNPPGQRDW
jgi:hypothetical protein